MKGRPKTVRKISCMPAVSGFKPYGGVADKPRKESVFLFYEEYEALRLSDYDKHSQCESAAIMQVSRPTFTRIYMSAREKIAKAFVEGLRIIVEGGKVELDGEWMVCHKCKAVFSNEGGEGHVCALCGSEDVVPYSLQDSEDIVGASPVTPVSSLGNAVTDTLQLDLSSRRRGCQKRRCRKGGEDHESDTD